MTQRFAIVGAGLIGATMAFHLVRRGHQVTVFDAGLPGHAASGRSFGWLNASFHADEDHFRLRVFGMEAWRRLKADLPHLSLRWPGALWWETQGEPLYDMRRKLGALGYPVELLTRKELSIRLPDLAGLPDEALGFPAEGVAETGEVVSQTLQAAQVLGAQVYAGVPVTEVLEDNDRVRGVQTPYGQFEADHVLLTAGTGSALVLEKLGFKMPLLQRPGVLLRSAPLPQLIGQILITPHLELRQDAKGRLIFPISPQHQGGSASDISDLDGDVSEAQGHLSKLLPRINANWEQASVAMRPVPKDGLPAVGKIGPRGLYTAVMHSGATLAAGIAEIAVQEILDDVSAPMLARYRPGRFQ